MICSTLNGMMVIKHPKTGVLVREDGMVFNKIPGGNHKNYGWKRGYIDDDGYYRVTIRSRTFLVHRLVAECFLPNPESKPTVDHINRTRTDNRVENLRWATYHEQVENSSQVLERADYGVRASENKKEYSKNYSQANKERIRETNRKWYAENYERIRDKKRAQCKAWYEKHKADRIKQETV